MAAPQAWQDIQAVLVESLKNPMPQKSHKISGAARLDHQRPSFYAEFVTEESFRRFLRLTSIEVSAALRRQLFEHVEAIAEYERVHPAITWPIVETVTPEP